MTTQVKHIVRFKKASGQIIEEILDNRDQMSRWIKMIRGNGYKVISTNTRVVRG